MNALVTGAAGNGMGRSIALTLAKAGHSVAINYRNSRESAEIIATHIRNNGGIAHTFWADVFDLQACEQLVQQVNGQLGEIDILIVNPGAGWHPEPPADLDPAAGLQDTGNELAPIFNLGPLVLPHMQQQRWGRIIAIAMSPPYNSPAYSYNVAKAARASAMKILARDTWKHGVTVNTLSPGPVQPIEDLSTATNLANHGDTWHTRQNITPQDIAEATAFLCSPAADYITAADIPFEFRHT